MATSFPAWAFQRVDDSPDSVFYALPRMVVHLDEPSLMGITQLYRQLLPAGGTILDIMSSWKSHLPDEVEYAKVCGLGLNAEEMRCNDRLDEFVVHDVNKIPHLPFPDESYDAAVMAVSVQYLTKPVELFAEVGRTLKSKGAFIVTYSHRHFPTKAVYIWQSLDMGNRRGLIETYFRDAGCFDETTFVDRSPDEPHDPMHAIWALRSVRAAGADSSVGEL